MNLISGLDKSQVEAVLHNEGPLLVLAGAGSGKTRVLTHRIARLVKEKLCKPSEILSVTFTNKAATEMRERIAKLVGKDSANEMTISTFHSFGVKIMRRFGYKIGYSENFTILDDGDRASTIKTIMRNERGGKAKGDFGEVAGFISLAKNSYIDPEKELKKHDEFRKEQRLYKHYHSQLKKRMCVDFDDLLLLPLKILREYEDVLSFYQKKYSYISIDEFQDTNLIQLELARYLAAPKNNIMAVGDDDQGIYSWRGAKIENILNFDKFFRGAKTVILNKNYRSTEEIVNGAYGVISQNKKRKFKKVTAASTYSHPIVTYRADDEQTEVEWILNKINEHKQEKIFEYNDHAILFRTNTLIKRFEEELRIQRIPYIVQGAMSYFDRKEVKDIFAYLRFFANKKDELSLNRILKVPNRGITPSLMEKLEELAGFRRISLWEAFERCEDARGINSKQIEKVKSFVDFVSKYDAMFSVSGLSYTVSRLIDETGYIEYVKKAYKDDKSLEMRLEIVNEIVHGIEIFEVKKTRSGGEATLIDYVNDFTLTATDKEENTNNRGVTLMTLHKSKGLEFPVVFIPILDDKIVPSQRSASEGKIEEERRLFYVGLTRAQKRLYLTYPDTKLVRKSSVKVTPSRFLREIPEEFLDAKIGEKEDNERDKFADVFFAEMQAKFSDD